jgi:hypothetical protein
MSVNIDHNTRCHAPEDINLHILNLFHIHVNRAMAVTSKQESTVNKSLEAYPLYTILLLCRLTIRIRSNYKQTRKIGAVSIGGGMLQSILHNVCRKGFTASLQTAASLSAYCYVIKLDLGKVFWVVITHLSFLITAILVYWCRSRTWPHFRRIC